MKKHIPLPSLIIASALYFTGAAPSSAQVYAQDDANGYTNTYPPASNRAWMYKDTTNGGFGFYPWVFTRGGSNFQGFFLSTGDAISPGTNQYWGMYANGPSNNNAAVAYRAFSNSMPALSVFKIKWHTKGIGGSSTTKRGGFSLRNGNANSTTNDYETGARFSFYYIGGGTDNFVIMDGDPNAFGAPQRTAIPLGFSANPFDIELTLLTADTYRLVIKDPTATTTVAVFDNLTLANSGTLDSVSLYALQTDGDQVFNSMSISSTSLVPPDIGNITPTNGSIYVGVGSNLSFSVTSEFSTIVSNNIKLVLNGVTQSNLTFTGSGTSSNYVVMNNFLPTNALINGTITATDANGNRATNNFTMNTWVASTVNVYVEASDYNYNSGLFLDNFVVPQPNQGYQGLPGSNGVDYLEYDLTGTNHPNAFRPGDLPQIEAATDQDHDNFADPANSFQPYNLAFIENGEWQNYTRRLSNVTYNVYARMAGFGNSRTMLMERLATATATGSNQPRASLGTFVCPNTGGAQNWTFVPLTDFFSNPVDVRSGGTNTFRLTCLGSDGSYNVGYLIFVPSTNTATIRPYISSGYPYPGVTGVGPDAAISFNIANAQTTVSPGTIQLFLNGTNVTTGLVLSNNAAGTTVNFQPTNLLSAGLNTLQARFGDGSVNLTNTWTFSVANLPVVPTGDALPSDAGMDSGFAIHIFKVDDNAPPSLFTSVAKAEQELLGAITNSDTSLPYPNLAAGPNGDGRFHESGTINYDITGTPQASFTFNTKSPFPYLAPVAPGGTNNFIALEALFYVQLTAGVHTFAVRSDDGFKQTVGVTVCDTNLVLGIFDAGRGNDFPSTYDFIVQTNGLYPMRLLYFQGEFGGNIEFYSVNRTNGENILINDSTNPRAVKAYPALKTTITSVNHSGNTTSFSFKSENCRTHTVQYKNSLSDPLWQSLSPTISGDGTVKSFNDTTATGSSRFYHVMTQ